MERPIIIEFSGLPNSGKTTLLHGVDKLCKLNDVSAIILQEPAERFPKMIPKGSVEQNLWITLETLQQSLEISNMSGTDFILLDRGFYNQLFWATMYADKNPLYAKYVLHLMEEFAMRYQVKPNYLYVVDVDENESIKRRIATGEPVTFSKKDFLVNYRKKFREFYQAIESRFYIDTTEMTKDEVAEVVFKQITALR